MLRILSRANLTGTQPRLLLDILPVLFTKYDLIVYEEENEDEKFSPSVDKSINFDTNTSSTVFWELFSKNVI